MAKCETNKERVSREVKRRADLIMAKSLAYVIRNLMMVKMTGTKRALEFTEQNCASVGSILLLCSEEEVPSILRLVADTFEGKPAMHGSTLSGYDFKVTSAYIDACMLVRDNQRSFPQSTERSKAAFEISCGPLLEPPLLSELLKTTAIKPPSFSEFLNAFREKNPRMKVQDRVLRRTLQRMGYSMRADKRGRPKGK